MFATLVQSYALIPRARPVTFGGVVVSEKLFGYIMGLQLLVTGGVSGAVAAGTGVLASVLYHRNVVGVQSLSIPKPIVSVCGPLMSWLFASEAPIRTNATSKEEAAHTRGVTQRSGARGEGTHSHTLTHSRTHSLTHSFIHSHTHTYVYMYIYIYIYIYIYVCIILKKSCTSLLYSSMLLLLSNIFCV